MPWQAARDLARRVTPSALASPPFRGGVRALPAAAIVVWALAAWFLYRPSSILLDWNSVRQTDTQAIARHFAEPGANLFYPRIDWGGDGPGFVETEFPLYSGLVALFLRVFGDVVWPGQLISLLATVLAAFALHRSLDRRLGPLPATAGLGVFLAAPVTLFGATSVQPDALALLGFIVAWEAFLRYVDRPDRKALVLFGVSGTLAMLIKPTMAQLGIDTCVYVLITARPALKRPALWLTWLAMSACLAAWLHHAAMLNAVYGNTFGVLSGYDSKMPKLEHLFMPRLYYRALTITRQWGLGLLGTFAVAWAVVQRRGHAATLALASGALVWMVVSLRYSAEHYGTHYTMCATIVGVYAAAQCVSRVNAAYHFVTGVVALVAVGFGLQRASVYRRWQPQADVSSATVASAAEAVGKYAQPGDLLIFRTKSPAYDQFWRTPFNVNDPRLFYATRTRGWCLPSDTVQGEDLEVLRKRGARFYVEPYGTAKSPSVGAWLGQHGRLRAVTPAGGEVYSLAP